MSRDHWPSWRPRAGAAGRPAPGRTDAGAGPANHQAAASASAWPCYPLDMAQKRKRPSVTLTLDPEIRAEAQRLLEAMPGKPSLSQLIDELLGGFIESVGPILEQMKAATAGIDADAVRRVLGEQMLALGAEAGKVNEALKNLPPGPLPEPIDWTAAARSADQAARAIREARKRKE